MADDNKRSELACTKVTERMYVDLNRSAAIDERSLSDYLFRLIRKDLYGNAARFAEGSRSTSSNKVDHDDA